MATEHFIGPHRYIVDADLIHNMPDRSQPLDLEMMQAYTALVEPIFIKYGRIFLLNDASSVFNVSAPARRHLAEWARGAQIAASATYGGNYTSRTLIKMIESVMAISDRNRGRLPAKQAFFSTETEARAWLERERDKYLAAHPDAPR